MLLCIALLGGFALRWNAVVSNTGCYTQETGDGYEYRSIALSLFDGRKPDINARETTRMYGYPFLLSLGYRLAGNTSGHTARCVNLALSMLAIPLIYGAGTLAVSPLAGGLGALLLAATENQVRMTASHGIEAICAFFTALIALALVWWVKKPGSAERFFLLSLAIAASLLTRSTMLLLPPLLLACVWLATKSLRKTALAALIASLTCAALLLPVSLARHRQLGTYSPFEQAKSAVLFYHATRYVNGGAFITEGEPVVTVMDTFPFKDWDPVLYRLAFRNIRAHPLEYLAKIPVRAAHLWVNSFQLLVDNGSKAEYTIHQTWALRLAVIALIIAGTLAFWRRREIAVLLVLAFYMNIYLALPLDTRYSTHFGPIFCLLAGLGIYWVGVKLRILKAPPPPEQKGQPPAETTTRHYAKTLAALTALFALEAATLAGCAGAGKEALTPAQFRDRVIAMENAEQYGKALALLDKYPELTATDPGMRNAKGVACYKTLRLEQAEKEFTAAVKLSGNNIPEALLNRAAALTLQLKFGQAKRDLDAFISARGIPDDIMVSALRRRAALNLSLCNMPEAYKDLCAAAAKTEPDSPTAQIIAESKKITSQNILSCNPDRQLDW